VQGTINLLFAPAEWQSGSRGRKVGSLASSCLWDEESPLDAARRESLLCAIPHARSPLLI